jgi:hypothetical protein
VAGHIVQIIVTGKCNSECINSIVSSELKYLTYIEAIYVLDDISKRLPKIFKGVERELEIKVEEKYKKKL